jgi:apolipoprotein N-acyltransferase
MLFFLGIFNWILVVSKYTLLHHGLLAFYLGFYFAIFGLAFSFLCTRWSWIPALVAAPFVWVSLEYIRSNLSFLSLPWGLLAHSQYQYLPVIQIASIAGTYSISFLILLVNAVLVATAYPHLPKLSGHKIPADLSSEKGGLTHISMAKGKTALIFLTASLVLLTLLYGQSVTKKSIQGDGVKISLVQANIDQSIKWVPAYAKEIMQIYAELTEAVSKDRPDLIVWPETATPGSVTRNPWLYMEVLSIAKRARTNLLFGSAQDQKFDRIGTGKVKISNSAFFLNPEPAVSEIQRYDKIRLFPFGEYLPYKDFIPWSLIKAGGFDSYSPGKECTIFRMRGLRFGVSICWEDIFPDLVRQFAKRGAQFMVNITNEAHFGRTAAPYQLASISVFRAIENRIFVVRCANTGISCIIDPYGRIIDRVKDEKGQDIFVRGVMTGWIVPLESKTIYTQYGDLLVWVAFLGTAIFLATSIMKKLRKN